MTDRAPYDPARDTQFHDLTPSHSTWEAEAKALRAENERLREALGTSISYIEGILEDGCPQCGGDCSSANSPPAFCTMKEVSADLAAARAALNTEGEE